MNRVLAMPRRTVLYSLVALALVAAAGFVDPGLALAFSPAMLLLALLTCGFRPGETLIERLRARRQGRPAARAVSAPRPRLALVVRPVGVALASALAMRPPPAPLAITA
jgi:hypothetical protein